MTGVLVAIITCYVTYLVVARHHSARADPEVRIDIRALLQKRRAALILELFVIADRSLTCVLVAIIACSVTYLLVARHYGARGDPEVCHAATAALLRATCTVLCFLVAMRVAALRRPGVSGVSAVPVEALNSRGRTEPDTTCHAATRRGCRWS
jgi:hypothetical protein